MGGDLRRVGASLGTVPSYDEDPNAPPGVVLSDVVPDGAGGEGRPQGRRPHRRRSARIEIRNVNDLMFVLAGGEARHRRSRSRTCATARRETVTATYGVPRSPQVAVGSIERLRARGSTLRRAASSRSSLLDVLARLGEPFLELAGVLARLGDLALELVDLLAGAVASPATFRASRARSRELSRASRAAAARRRSSAPRALPPRPRASRARAHRGLARGSLAWSAVGLGRRLVARDRPDPTASKPGGSRSSASAPAAPGLPAARGGERGRASSSRGAARPRSARGRRPSGSSPRARAASRSRRDAACRRRACPSRSCSAVSIMRVERVARVPPQLVDHPRRDRRPCASLRAAPCRRALSSFASRLRSATNCSSGTW